MVRTFILLLGCLCSVFLAQSQKTIRIYVHDVLSGDAISKPLHVELFKRKTDHYKGAVRVHPLSASQRVFAQVYESSEGAFVSLNPNEYYALKLSSAGYTTKWITLLSPDLNSKMHVSMLKQNLSPQEKKQHSQILERQNNQMLLKKHADKDTLFAQKNQHNLPEKSLDCSFEQIPDYIYVKNLKNDYNASANGSGFEGYIHFDEYVAGVVQGEVSYASSLESKKAQAIASRTFALRRHLAGLTPNLKQAYNFSPNSLSWQAAMETSKQVLLHQGQVIDAKFSARCNNRFTQAAEEGAWAPNVNCSISGTPIPYLKSVSCNNHYDCHAIGESPCCDVQNARLGYQAGIHGHGVGMCQRGMMRFGEDSNYYYTYDQILNHYYTDVCIANFDASLIDIDCEARSIELIEQRPVHITNTVENSQINFHPCYGSDNFLGNEHYFIFQALYDGDYTVHIQSDSASYTLFYLDYCDDISCLAYSETGMFEITGALASDWFYFLVDKKQPGADDFTIEIIPQNTDSNQCSFLRTSDPLYIDGVDLTDASDSLVEDGAALVYFSGGTPPYALMLEDANGDTISVWSESSPIALQNLPPDDYFIELTDANGCNDFSVFTIGVNALEDSLLDTTSQMQCSGLSLSFTVIHTMADSAQGSIQAHVLGNDTSTYHYEWSTQSFTPQINNLQSGTYAVTVEFSNGCVLVDSAFVANQAQDSTITGQTDTLDACVMQSSVEVTHFIGNTFGALEAQVVGGVAPYAFKWYYQGDFWANTQRVEGLLPGNYKLILTDSEQCSDTSYAQIFHYLEDPESPSGVSSLEREEQYDFLVFPQPADGVLTIQTQGYKGAYQFKLHNILGELIWSTSVNTSSVHLQTQAFASGVYVLSALQDGRLVGVKQVLIKH